MRRKFPLQRSTDVKRIVTIAQFGPGDAVAITILFSWLGELERETRWRKIVENFPTSRPLWTKQERKVLLRNFLSGEEWSSMTASSSILNRLNILLALSLTWALNRQGWKLVNSCDVFCLIRRKEKKNKKKKKNQDFGKWRKSRNKVSRLIYGGVNN